MTDPRPFRTAHGANRSRGRLTASECPPLDELPAASPAVPARPDRDSHGHFVRGNAASRSKKVRAGKRGALARLEQSGDDAARAAIAFGRRYAAHRRAELTRAHGEISAGVAAMVESAGVLLSSSRYWGARSSAEGDPDFARLSAQLAAGARQAERDAWQLAALEAASRPRAPAHVPWMTTTGEPRDNAHDSARDNAASDSASEHERNHGEGAT